MTILRAIQQHKNHHEALETDINSLAAVLAFIRFCSSHVNNPQITRVRIKRVYFSLMALCIFPYNQAAKSNLFTNLMSFISSGELLPRTEFMTAVPKAQQSSANLS